MKSNERKSCANFWIECFHNNCTFSFVFFFLFSRFLSHDKQNRQHKIRGGEEIFDLFDFVEDTKGNPNDRGRMLATNLRLIWYSTTNNKFNLCKFCSVFIFIVFVFLFFFHSIHASIFINLRQPNSLSIRIFISLSSFSDILLLFYVPRVVVRRCVAINELLPNRKRSDTIAF